MDNLGSRTRRAVRRNGRVPGRLGFDQPHAVRPSASIFAIDISS